MPNVHYCLCVTSCDRHDLLKDTLDSFIVACEAKPRMTIICEDSNKPMPSWLAENMQYYESRLNKITWLSNEARIGQVFSIDRLIGAIPKDITLVCWLEDDWHFEGTGFITQALQILDKYPKISQVVFRSDWNHTLIDQPGFEGFKIAMPGWKGNWGGWTWNPHMTRVSTMRQYGSYASQAGYVNGLKHELVFSEKFLNDGYRIAALPFHCSHTGGARSRSIDQIAPIPKILIAIPVCHRFDYGAWESGDSPLFDKGKAWRGEAYGTGIHITGENNRVAALRETWLQDVKKYPTVDYKLFFGEPHGREPLADEVFLKGVPDDYASLRLKTFGIAKYTLDNGYDYLFKADDDTLVYVDGIVQELMSTRLDYGGFAHGRICTGGTGYWLSKRAFKEIVRNPLGQHWAEDVTVGRIMDAAGIYPLYLAGHHTGKADHWFWPEGKFDPTKLPDYVTTIHAVQPEVMRDWYRWKERK